MYILAWILIGVIAGSLAKVIYPGHQGGGLISTVLLGIVGASIGGSLALFVDTGHFALVGTALSIPGIAIALLGSIIAIFLWTMFTKDAKV